MLHALHIYFSQKLDTKEMSNHRRQIRILYIIYIYCVEKIILVNMGKYITIYCQMEKTHMILSKRAGNTTCKLCHYKIPRNSG